MHAPERSSAERDGAIQISPEAIQIAELLSSRGPRKSLVNRATSVREGTAVVVSKEAVQIAELLSSRE